MRLFVVAVFCVNVLLAQAPKAKLIYVGDPMCSWCYGFTPEIELIRKKYEAKLEIQMVMGGLNTKQNIPLDQEMKASLLGHWEEIANSTGQLFKYDILNKAGLIYNTEAACRAVVAVREIDSTMAYPMFKALQTAFYAQNTDITTVEGVAKVAEALGINGQEFLLKYNSKAVKDLTKADFERAERNGIDGFPALILLHGAKIVYIANGYEKADKIEKALKKHLF